MSYFWMNSAQNRFLILTTHYLEEAEGLADRLAILMDGRFAVVGRPDEVMTSGEPAVQAFLAGEAR